jgi:hypothetical protein
VAAIVLLLVATPSWSDVVMCFSQEIRSTPGNKVRTLAVHCGMTVYLRTLREAEQPVKVRTCMVGFNMIRCSDENDYTEEPGYEQARRASAERQANKEAEMRRKLDRCVSGITPQGMFETPSAFESRKSANTASCLTRE